MTRSPVLLVALSCAFLGTQFIHHSAAEQPDSATVYVTIDGFVYSQTHNSADLLHGDSLSIRVASAIPDGAVSVVAYAQYEVGPNQWKPIDASRFGRDHNYVVTNQSAACTWGKMPRLPQGTRLQLFMPYRACEFGQGTVKVRYRVLLRSGDKVIHDSTVSGPELEIENNRPKRIIVKEGFRYAA